MTRHLGTLFSVIFLLFMYPCQTPAGRITPEKTELGVNSQANGLFSTAIGQNATAWGDYSTALGVAPGAFGDYSTAIGSNNFAVGDFSTAMGVGTEAKGRYSTAMGSYTIAHSAWETVIGRYPTKYYPLKPNGWDGADRLFVIGNGTNELEYARSDAMVVLKSGDVTFNGSASINNAGEGNVLLYLGTERHWQLRQFGTGASTALELASASSGGNKNFIITTAGNVGIGKSQPSSQLHVYRASPGPDEALFKVSGFIIPEKTFMVVNGDGNIGIGNSNPGYLLEMESSGGGYYSASDHQWHNGSSRAIKQDIKDNEMDISKILDDVEIVNYRYKTEVKKDRNAPYHIGFIAEETPALLSGNNRDGMAMGDCIGLLFAAVKEQQCRISK